MTPYEFALQLLGILASVWGGAWLVTGHPLMLLYVLRECVWDHARWCADWNHLSAPCPRDEDFRHG